MGREWVPADLLRRAGEGFTLSRLGLLACCASLLFSCGKEADPHPPLPRIPKAVSPAVQQVGDVVDLRLDWPSTFVDGTPMPDWRGMEIYAVTMPAMESKLPTAPTAGSVFQRKNLLAELPRAIAESKKDGGALKLGFSLKDLRLAPDKPSAVFWGLVIVGPKGQRGVPSAITPFLVLPPLSPVTDLKAESAPEGVRITFTSPGEAVKVRLTRAVGAGLPAILEELPKGKTLYVDANAHSGGVYTYWAAALGSVEGHTAAPAAVMITYVDAFPPPAPERVVYLPLDQGARIQYGPSTGATAYKIYRQCAGDGTWTLVGQTGDLFLEVPSSICDFGVASVDEAGNVSAVVKAQREEP